MTGDYRDPNTWRGITQGGVHFKLIDSTGEFEQNTGSARETYLVHRSQLLRFVLECFPPPVFQFGVPIFNNRRLPGTNLRARRLSYKGHIPGIPTDPFYRDREAASATYNQVLEVEVEYTNEKEKADPLDPSTYLTIKGNAAGEYITGGTPKASWQEPNGSVTENKFAAGVPLTITVPQTQWDVTWDQVPREYFHETMIVKLRSMMGKVNSDTLELLFDAAPETLLFVGFDFEEKWTRYIDENILDALTYDDEEELIDVDFGRYVTVSMKFLEKRIDNPDFGEGDVVEYFGHQHTWKPDEGWRKILVDGTNPPYKSTTFTDLFAQLDTDEDEEEEG